MLSEEMNEYASGLEEDVRRELNVDSLGYIQSIIGWIKLKATNSAKLERVARAAEGAWPFMFDDIPKALDSKRSRYEELYDALADLPEDAPK